MSASPTEGTDMNHIEKVARAIWDQQRNHWGHYRDMVPDLCEWEELTQSKQRELMREAKAAIAAMPVQAEPVAWRYTRADGHFFLAPNRCRAGYPEADGWTETPLYAFPTRPQEAVMQSERTTFEALNSALRFAASRSAITSAEELAIMAAWNARASDAEITRLTEALRAAEEREKALVRLVERAQVNTPDQYVNWHEDARQALAGAKP